ncbi:hypothetical protein [Verrucomicrobium spinosum]|uniref:hypothetical protein n=1 Tax=Verrucomicrobium spinosum TaxID=2736 RepID=UPI00210B5031|nr:hypothetical protein [Verrucomicrobium spinosum]
MLKLLQRLAQEGHSILVIEHNMEVIKCADWVIDLGPEAGATGGHVVVTGTPETVAACDASWTGRYLGEVLEGSGAAARRAASLKEASPRYGSTTVELRPTPSRSAGPGSTTSRTSTSTSRATRWSWSQV